MTDLINHPSHYEFWISSLDGELIATDAINILQGLTTKIEDQSCVPLTSMDIHYLCSAVAYILRSPFKDSFESDIQKAIFYLRMMIGDDPRV